MFLAQLESYRSIALVPGERQLLLSVLGLVAILCLNRCWRQQSSASRLSVWVFFLFWLVWDAFGSLPEYLQTLQTPLHQYLNLVNVLPFVGVGLPTYWRGKIEA